jgi:hypothetical protein
MAKHKLFCVPGTWEVVEAANSRPEITPDAEVGMLTGITNVLDRRVFDIVYVNYPASFGPIPGPGQNVLDALGDPSYIDSLPPNIFRAIKTGFDLGVFLRDNPHDKYGVWQIIPGWTALQHSANHLNFWGPRLPDFVDVASAV